MQDSGLGTTALDECVRFSGRTAGWEKKQFSPSARCHFHAGVKSWLTLEIIHDNAMVTVDDMLVNPLPPKMLQNFVYAVDTVQNGLQGGEEEWLKTDQGFKNHLHKEGLFQKRLYLGLDFPVVF